MPPKLILDCLICTKAVNVSSNYWWICTDCAHKMGLEKDTAEQEASSLPYYI